MKTSEAGIELIRRWESISLEAVRLPGEAFYTIGYGHYGPEVRPGSRVTLQEAETRLKQDLRQFEAWVEAYTPYPLNQNQFDALVSFTYNLGPENLKRLVTGRTAAQTAEHMTAYTGSSSEVYREGLLNRRRAERALFLTPWKEETQMTEEELLSLEGTGDQPSDWAREATEWAKSRGLIRGDGQGNYGWQKPVTREALAVILRQLAGEE